MVKPIYITQASGTCYHSGFGVDANGNLQQIGFVQYGKNDRGEIVKISQRILTKNAPLWGVECMDAATFEKKFNNPQNPPSNKMANYQDPALLPVKTNGGTVAMRQESLTGSGKDKGIGETLFISFDNTLGAAPAQIVLGDAGQAIAGFFLATPPPPPGFVIGGDKGISTLAYYQNMMRSGLAIRLKTDITFRAFNALGGAAPQLFGGNTVQEFVINNMKGTSTQNIPIDFLVKYKGDQFDLSVRHFDDYDFTLGSKTAMVFNIPAGFVFSMSANIYSYTDASTMVLAGMK